MLKAFSCDFRVHGPIRGYCKSAAKHPSQAQSDSMQSQYYGIEACRSVYKVCLSVNVVSQTVEVLKNSVKPCQENLIMTRVKPITTIADRKRSPVTPRVLNVYFSYKA